MRSDWEWPRWWIVSMGIAQELRTINCARLPPAHPAFYNPVQRVAFEGAPGRLSAAGDYCRALRKPTPAPWSHQRPDRCPARGAHSTQGSTFEAERRWM